MKQEFKQWTTAYKDNLPDSSFAYISKGGHKDKSGKTTPRSLRHLPYKDADGKVDLPHLRNALARLSHTDIPASAKAEVRKKLESALHKTKASEKHIGVFPFEFAMPTASVPDEIHLIPIGTWQHEMYGEIVITPEDIEQFAQNFDAGIRKGVPITAGHEGAMEQPAVGWLTKVEARETGLWGTVDWNDSGKALLSDRAFKFFSPEFYREYEDPQTHETYSNVLVGGALTKSPYFKELEAVVFSEPHIKKQFSDDIMNIEEIAAKNVADLTDEEKAFITEHQNELTDEQKEAFGEVLGNDNGSGADETDGNDDAADEVKDDENNGDTAGDEVGNDKVEASEKGGFTKISAAEYAALKAQANKGAQAFKELEKMQLGQRADKMVFTQSNLDGRFLPKQKDSLVSFMLTLSEKQRDQFANLVNNMPKHSKQLFAEVGDGGSDTVTDAAKQVDMKVKEAMKASDKLTYSAALTKVFTENPELAKRYNDELFGEEN